jgi:S-(hydroxymethyl)glutathione dehydrogenase/alcohol dehydrogenase
MKTRAAVLWEEGGPWKVEDVEVDAPGPGEVVVSMRACGTCHSDDHVLHGEIPVLHYPFMGGHEGAGEVVEVGPGVTTVAVGDHVAFSFVPSCGRCRWCADGQSYLCDEGAKLFNVGMMSDDRIAHRIGDQAVARMVQLGAFTDTALLNEVSVVKVDRDLPWHAVALVSCGVATGYGSAVHRAGTRPGDTAVVVGVGGVGMSAVQGARIAGATTIIAIDPLASRREAAKTFGATHTFASMDEAMGPVGEITQGVMAERVIMTPGVMTGDLLDPGLNLTAKGGTCVVTGVANWAATDAKINLFMFAMSNKELKGTLYGSSNPRREIPYLLSLYRSGALKLDEMVTKTYPLEELNQAYQDMADGTILRGMLTF